MIVETIASIRTFRGGSRRAYLLGLGTLATLALYFLAWAYPTFPGDESALVKFQGLRSDWLDDTAIWFANLGLIWVFVPAVAVLMGCLVLARRYADTVMMFAGLVVIGIGNGLKIIVDRPRPEYQILDPLQSGLSFPSGHSLLAVILGGILVYLVGHWVRPLLLRRAIQASLIVMVVGMGASRVYLGLHWPSDVIGSYVLGGMALVGLIGLRNAVATAR